MIEEPRLLDRLRDKIRLKHYSIRTEKAYLDWNRRFILFHNKKHPRNMGTQEVEQFLTYLAVNGRVASSTQNQALSAILFIYNEKYNVRLLDKKVSRRLLSQTVLALLKVSTCFLGGCAIL